MRQLRLWIVLTAVLFLASCATSESMFGAKAQEAAFPAEEFARFIPYGRDALKWSNITKVSGSLVWESSDSKYLAITREGKAVALIEPGASTITYILIGSSNKAMRYRVNNRDVEGAILDFVYDAL